MLAQGVNWGPTNGEPFLNPAASINSTSNGWALQFGGIPVQNYNLQTASSVTGPWANISTSAPPNIAGILQFTDTNAPAKTTRFYRTQGTALIY